MTGSKYYNTLHQNKLKYDNECKQIEQSEQYKRKLQDKEIHVKIDNIHEINKHNDIKLSEYCMAINKNDTVWNIVMIIVAHNSSITAEQYYNCIKVRLFFKDTELYYDENVHKVYKEYVNSKNHDMIFHLTAKIDNK